MKDRWEVLANYMEQGIAQTKIAQILGVSDAAVSLTVNDPEFQLFYTEHLKKVSSVKNDYDEGWDGLEKLALGNLIKVMGHSAVMFDPKLNLQIAMVANKAQRRLSRFNTPLNAENAGATPVVVSLQTVYINKLQQNTQINNNGGSAETARSKMLSGQQVQNLPSPSKIEKTLNMSVLEEDTPEKVAERMLAELKIA